MIKTVNGNILEASEDILCQQVNCKGVMGSGLALQIKEKYPEVFKSYSEMCSMYKPAKMLGQAQVVKCNSGKFVANLFGQNNYGTKSKQTDYVALADSFNRLFNAVTNIDKYKGKSVAIPYGIGCGLGGGDWDKVIEIIESTSEFYKFNNITIYKF